ncbi:hypothetical protein DVH05_010585 [Phytophthora capsici]|nr:hypothetical protein DVH05_010585 [Phytophthora capsici]
MAAPTGQAPRQTLTEDVRRRCLEGMLSDRHKRRIRRADGKTSAGASYQKKGSRKKPAKRTTPAMEVAQSKGLSEDHRPGGRPPERVEDAEAKGRACGEASDAMETAPAAPPEDRVDHAAVAAVVEAIVDCVAVAEATTPVRSPANDEKASRPSKTRLPPLSEAASRKRRRANLPDGSDGDSDSEVCYVDGSPNKRTHVERNIQHITNISLVVQFVSRLLPSKRTQEMKLLPSLSEGVLSMPTRTLWMVGLISALGSIRTRVMTSTKNRRRKRMHRMNLGMETGISAISVTKRTRLFTKNSPTQFGRRRQRTRNA